MKYKDKCEYCKEAVTDETAIKCKTCGERFDNIGKLLKIVPIVISLASVLITIASLVLAFNEFNERKKATQQAIEAEKAHIAVSRKLDIAEQANWEFARKLPELSKKEIKDDIIRDLRLPLVSPSETLKQLEQKAKESPENSRIQKNLYIFRTLKEPD